MDQNHKSSRRAFFTPHEVAGGPTSKCPLQRLRITRGRFFATGKRFKIIDDWTVRADAHRLLDGAWLGTTDFRELADFIDDDSDDDEEELEDGPKGPEHAAEETPGK